MDRRVGFVTGAVVAIALAGVGGWLAMRDQVPRGVPVPPPPRSAPAEQVVVKYASDASAERVHAFERAHGLHLAKELPQIRAKVYDVPVGATSAQVIGWFTSEPGLVAYAEPNGTVQAIP